MLTPQTPSTLTTLGWCLHAGGILVTIGLAAGSWYGIDYFVNSHIDRIERRYSATAKFLKTAPAVEKENQQLHDDIAARSSHFEELLARIPPDARESDFLAQVSDLAERCELTIRDYRPGTAASQSRHSELEIQLAADGSYAALCRFLDGVHTLPRLSRVTTLKISAASDLESATYPAEMTLRIYFAQFHAEPAPPEASRS